MATARARGGTGARRLVRRAQGVIASVQLRFRKLKTRFDATKPGRTHQRYGDYNGNVLAGGIAYYSLTSLAAGMVLAATVASLLAQVFPGLRPDVFSLLGQLIPGTVGDDGLVTPDARIVAPVAGVVGLGALVALANTATRFMGGLRTAVRTMLGRKAGGNAIEGKARDYAALLGLVVVLGLGLALQVASSRAASWLVDKISLGAVDEWVVRAPASAVGLLADMAFVALALLVLGRARVTWSRLWRVLLVAGVIMGVLRQASSAIVGSAADNRVLAPFAAIVTLLAFVELVTRVVLYAAAWIGSRQVAGAVAEEPQVFVDTSPARRRSRVTTRRAAVRR